MGSFSLHACTSCNEIIMEFFPLGDGGGGSSSKNSEVKMEESDLLRRVGECCDEEQGIDGVDCTLSLGFSSATARSAAVLGDVESMQVVGCEKGSHDHARPILVPGHSVRKCLTCGKTETPLWRNGPNGAKSLCNACGIRFKKEERRASFNLGMANSSHTRTAKACDDKDAQITLELGTYKEPN